MFGRSSRWKAGFKVQIMTILCSLLDLVCSLIARFCCCSSLSRVVPVLCFVTHVPSASDLASNSSAPSVGPVNLVQNSFSPTVPTTTVDILQHMSVVLLIAGQRIIMIWTMDIDGHGRVLLEWSNMEWSFGMAGYVSCFKDIPLRSHSSRQPSRPPPGHLLSLALVDMTTVPIDILFFICALHCDTG